MRQLAAGCSCRALAVTALVALAACDIPSSPKQVGYPAELTTFQAHRSTDSLYFRATFATRACATGFVGQFDPARADSSTISVGIRVGAISSCPDTAWALFEALWVIRLAAAGTVHLVVDTTGGSTQVDVPGDGSVAPWPRRTDPCPGMRVYIAGIPLSFVPLRDSTWLTARAVQCAGMQPIGRVAWSVRDTALGSVRPVTDSQAVFRGVRPGDTFVRATGLDSNWTVEQFIRHATGSSP